MIQLIVLAWFASIQLSTAGLPRWMLIQGRTLGSSGEPAFGLVNDVVADSAGNTYVLDSKADPFVYAFAPDGRLRWSAGRRGDGPGEFQQPRVLGMHKESLWISDVRLRRFTRVRLNGLILKDVIVLPNSPNPRVRQSVPFALTKDGNVLVMDIGHPNSSRIGMALLHGKLSEVSADSLAFIERGQTFVEARISVNGTAGHGQFQQAFTDDPLVQPAKDGASIVIVDQKRNSSVNVPTFTVTKLSPRGDTVFSRQIPYSRELLNDQQYVAALEEIAQMLTRVRPGVLVSMDDLKSNSYRPYYLPPVKSLAVASDGTIWIHRHTPTNTSSYLVLGIDGNPIATTEVPRGQRVIESNGSTVWTLPIRHDQESIVSSYRIERPKERRQ
jgi:hypothetical protein